MPTFVLVVIVTLCTIFSQLILKRGVGQLVEVLKEGGAVTGVAVQTRDRLLRIRAAPR